MNDSDKEEDKVSEDDWLLRVGGLGGGGKIEGFSGPGTGAALFGGGGRMDDFSGFDTGAPGAEREGGGGLGIEVCLSFR